MEKVKLEEEPPLLFVTVAFSHLCVCHADRNQDCLLVFCQQTSSSHYAFAFMDTGTFSFVACTEPSLVHHIARIAPPLHAAASAFTVIHIPACAYRIMRPTSLTTMTLTGASTSIPIIAKALIPRDAHAP